MERARDALALAASGRDVAVVSGGDPGIFAMAAAIFEAIEAGDPTWRALDVGGLARRLGDAGGGGPARRTARP